MIETSDIHPGLSINASETGLLIRTLRDMPIGIKLKIELLFAKGFELSNLQGMVQIIWKDHHVWSDYKGYKYGLHFVQISNENYKKLKLLLENLFDLEDTTLYQPA
jgi:hypothetical protein